MYAVLRLCWGLTRHILTQIAGGLEGLVLGVRRSWPGQEDSRKGRQGRKGGKEPCSAAEGRNSSQTARVLADELPREAFGLRGACSRCRTTHALRQRQAALRIRVAEGGPSLRFAQFGSSFAALSPWRPLGEVQVRAKPPEATARP